jgi:protein tyrosine phosphatase
MSQTRVPSWLQNAHNQDHIDNAWRILADRERSRVRVKLLSAASSRYSHSQPAPTTQPPSAGINTTDHYSVALGCTPENRSYNRYSDILPYDHSRVDVGGRYFNGNWVRELAGGRWTISTQAPLPNTAHEFLSLVAGVHAPFGPPEEPAPGFTRVRTVVQLARNVESGRQKAHPYFPDHVGESTIIRRPSQGTNGLPPLRVTLVKTEVVESAQCVTSTVSVTPIVDGVSSEAVIFRHLLYGAWPDHGIPEPDDRAGLLNFIRLVDRTNKDVRGLEGTADAEPPVMVHCSAGIGRSGAFIALCSLLRSNGLLYPPSSSQPVERVPPRLPPLPQAPLGPLPELISWDEIAQEVDSLREQRPGMVERPEQARLVYEVLLAALTTKE